MQNVLLIGTFILLAQLAFEMEDIHTWFLCDNTMAEKREETLSTKPAQQKVKDIIPEHIVWASLSAIQCQIHANDRTES